MQAPASAGHVEAKRPCNCGAARANAARAALAAAAARQANPVPAQARKQAPQGHPFWPAGARLPGTAGPRVSAR